MLIAPLTVQFFSSMTLCSMLIQPRQSSNRMNKSLCWNYSNEILKASPQNKKCFFTVNPHYFDSIVIKRFENDYITNIFRRWVQTEGMHENCFMKILIVFKYSRVLERRNTYICEKALLSSNSDCRKKQSWLN